MKIKTLTLILILTSLILMGCAEKKGIDMINILDDNILNENQTLIMESKITEETKFILEKEKIFFKNKEHLILGMAINNILSEKKDFRIIIEKNDKIKNLISENSFGIIEIKDNEFKIIPLIITIPEKNNEKNYIIEINIEYKEKEDTWKLYDKKTLTLIDIK